MGGGGAGFTVTATLAVSVSPPPSLTCTGANNCQITGKYRHVRRKGTLLAAKSQRLVKRMGKKKALVAVGHPTYGLPISY